MSYLNHFCCDSGRVAPYVILVQSQALAECIGEKISAELISEGDLYHVYTGKFEDVPVSVIACGIGSPSAAMALEELALCGATAVIRLGTAQPIADNSKVGDVVLATAGVKMDGTSGEYVVMEFPAVANFPLTWLLARKAEQLLPAGSFHMGIVEGRDVFTRRKDFDRTLVSGSCIYEKALARGSALCSDMETAAVLVVSRYLGIRGASVNLVTAGGPADLSCCIDLALAGFCDLRKADESGDDLCLIT